AVTGGVSSYSLRRRHTPWSRDLTSEVPTSAPPPSGAQLQYFCVNGDSDDGEVFRTDTVYPPGGSTNMSTGGSLNVGRSRWWGTTDRKSVVRERVETRMVAV